MWFFIHLLTSYLLSALSQFFWLHKIAVYLKGLQSTFKRTVKYYSHCIHSGKMPAVRYQCCQQREMQCYQGLSRTGKLQEALQGTKTTFSHVLFKPIKWKSFIKTMWLQMHWKKLAFDSSFEWSCRSARKSPDLPPSYPSAFCFSHYRAAPQVGLGEKSSLSSSALASCAHLLSLSALRGVKRVT